MYLEYEHNFENKLISHACKQIQNTLHNIIKERSAEGEGGRPEQEYISEEHEQILWEKGILSEDSPDKLRQTINNFLFGWCSIWIARFEHDLRKYADSQIKIGVKDVLVYYEFQSKN